MTSAAGLDVKIFHLLNGTLTASLLDAVMPFVTDINHFTAVIFLAVAYLLVGGGAKGRWTVLLLLVALAASDGSAGLLKKAFARARPCHALEGIRLLVGCGSSYSFPSAHATNIFAAMVLLTERYRRYAPAFLFVAVLVAYSRVYVGVHYPSDIVAGAILGTLIALGLACGFRLVMQYARGRGDEDEREITN